MPRRARTIARRYSGRVGAPTKARHKTARSLHETRRIAPVARAFCDRRGVKGRIWFAKNPWPKGHRVKAATWSGHLDADTGSLYFDLDLQTDNYDAEGDAPEPRDEFAGDWKQPSVWTNYGSCSLSSTKWDQSGFVVGTAKKPLDWKKLDGVSYRVDKATKTITEDHHETAAFGIYLTGHDAVADHRIQFARAGRTWAIEWTAKIALAYIGSTDLKHRLACELGGMTFDGFAIPKGLAPKAAKALCDAAVADPAKWTLARGRYRRR